MIVHPGFWTSRSPMVASGGDVRDIRIGGAVWRTHVFEEDGVFTVSSLGPGAGLVEAFLVAGGGGGAPGVATSTSVPLCTYDLYGGGGGGGGVLIPRTLRLEREAYPVKVGAGGAGGRRTSQGSPIAAGNGGNSSAFDLTAIGGGRGGHTPEPPATGGSGGGNAQRKSFSCSGWLGLPGSGTSGQGQAALRASAESSTAGGTLAGGGAGYGTQNVESAGGDGYALDWLGEESPASGSRRPRGSGESSGLMYGSGAGGGTRLITAEGGPGAGSGGQAPAFGQTAGIVPTAGTPGRGGGGGGGVGVWMRDANNQLFAAQQDGAPGGSGIVIVRYRL